ncbi:MAG: toxin-antitoxin system HicB family antitoxin [Prolixibacteraceae bacterium]|nr:toxin-antitoxin system HicB family antitoxin [Prolixibacteraceae bacterium]
MKNKNTGKASEEKYTFRIEWSEEDGVFVARCLEFPGLGAHGDTQEKALQEIKTVVRESLDWLREEGKPVPEPLGLRKYKGNLTLRVPPEVHRQLAIKSAEEGVSVNQYILSKIS